MLVRAVAPVVLTLAACGAAPSTPPADTIYRGGTVVTMAGAGVRAEAIAIEGRRIVAVGTDADVMRARGPGTRVIDLGGHAIVPGFLESYGVLLRRADCTPDVVAQASAACARRGLTTIQEGGASADEVHLMTGVANELRLAVDGVAFAAWDAIDALAPELADMDCVGSLRLGGVAFAVGGLDQGEVGRRVRRCFAERWHVNVTVRSAAEVDLLLRAVEEAVALQRGPAPRVAAIVQTDDVTDAQLEAMERRGVIPSFGPAATAVAARAAAVPMLRFTLHDDAEDALPDPLGSIAAAVEAGVSQERALRAWTVDAAFLLRMEGRKGVIEPGKLADLAILSADPTALDAVGIRAVEILGTVKGGKVVFVAGD